MKNKQFILGILVGTFIFGSMGVFATTILTASDVRYIKEGSSITNVQNVIDELNTKSNQGNATSAQILKERTALVNGSLVTGTMPNKSGWTSTPTEKGKVTIPEGYHDGTGYVDTSSVYNVGVSHGLQKIASITNSSSSTTYNASSIANYKSLTTSNFLVVPTNIYVRIYDGDRTSNLSPNISYNSTTGVLTISNLYTNTGSVSKAYISNMDIYLK